MIKDRNIAIGAAISPFKIAGNAMLGVGEVFYVYNYADDATVGAYLKTIVDSGHLFCHNNSDGLGLQAALDKTVSLRNDYVVVFPSDTNYQPSAVLTMSKKSVHLICPAGLTGNRFPGNTARLKQTTAANALIAISNQNVEVAGFYLKNYTALSHITLSAAAHAPNIHNNSFMLVWSGAQEAAIVGTTTGGAWGSIENNQFISESGTAQTAAIAAINIDAQATGCRVCNNEVTIGDANTATVCISNLAVKGHTDYNVFSTGGGTGGTGVITNAIVIPTLEACIGNRGALAAGTLLSGGTTATSFCDNLDATATAGTDHWNLAA